MKNAEKEIDELAVHLNRLRLLVDERRTITTSSMILLLLHPSTTEHHSFVLLVDSGNTLHYIQQSSR